MSARIVGVGHHLPERVMTNDEVAQRVDTSDEWITRRVGVRSRHVAAPDETVADMATRAGARALEHAGVAAGDIDMVVLATTTAKDRSPSNAARVAGALGIPGPAAMDVNTFCSGFCYALALADHAITAGSATTALVIGSDRFTDVVDWNDRSTCVLVGDGAGAAVVGRSDDAGISPVVWGSDPSLGQAVRLEMPSDRFEQDGKTVFRWAVEFIPTVAQRVCERAGIRTDQLGGVVLHQANLRIIDGIVQRLGADDAVIARDVVTSANTSAASVPVAFSKLVHSGELTSGTPTLLLGFGGGLAWAGQVVASP